MCVFKCEGCPSNTSHKSPSVCRAMMVDGYGNTESEIHPSSEREREGASDTR